MNKLNKIILVCFITILALFSGCSRQADQKSNISSVHTNTTQKPVEQKPQEEVKPDNTLYEVGTEATFGRAAITVVKVEKNPGEQFDEPKAGNEFVIVHIKERNLGPGNIEYNPYFFKLQNSKGQIVDQAITIVDSDTSLSSGELIPGGSVEGTITFEAPKNDPELTLLFIDDNDKPLLKFKLN